MGIWILMTFCALLVPGIMLLCGRMLQTAPPEQIDDWFGYRSKRSKSSPAAWEHAQQDKYDYVVINDVLEDCVEQILHIISKELDN